MLSKGTAENDDSVGEQESKERMLYLLPPRSYTQIGNPRGS